jgi:Ni2+-binding GTPase involved in maturation of urease and hydrogenase
MTAPRFVMVGGFLGAGKTTTVARLARHYQAQGRRVAIVTNDQAADLVDTNSLRAQGFDVGEVAGACFCCNFNELTGVVEQLGRANRPEVILAEPVGSCTDLVATVVRPLAQLYGERFDVAPYGVILKPSHGARILRNLPNAGFSPKAEYIFCKQLEEADFVILNRIDELPADEVAELAALVEAEYPGRPVLRMSARTGEGFAAVAEFVEQRGEFGQRLMELDYDVYAQGEAELGWLNAQATVEGPAEFALDGLLLELIGQLRARLAAAGAEPAHLKAIGLWEGFYGVANLVSSFTPPELSLASNCRARRAQLVVNARVALEPEALATVVREVVTAAAAGVGARATIHSLQSFRPGRPVPTHRILSAS